MTRLTHDERAAITAELDVLAAEVDRLTAERHRLQALLDASPLSTTNDDTVRQLRPLCDCGLPLEHRRPYRGTPLPCADETARIALPITGRPPVPQDGAR